jgi:FAD/FMN-containing dehydrogenase/ferredoxin
MVLLFWAYLLDQDTPRRRARIEGLAGELRRRVSPECRVASGYLERRLYSRDLARVPKLLEKVLHRTTPQLVVQPRSETDLSKVMEFASEKEIPVFPRGVSSSAFGGAVPTLNGIALDLSGMRAILHVDPDNRTIRVQAGVRWADLAERLRPLGLTPMATPSSRFSTVAGWAAAGGLGIESFGYGHVAEAVVGARAVLADGRAVKMTEGQPILSDFLGTEGQFGIFSELTLRVRDNPAHSRPRLLGFENAGEAFAFIEHLVQSSIRPSHVAYYDAARLEEENLYFHDRSGRGDKVVPEGDYVLLHFDDADEEARFLAELAPEEENAKDKAAAYFLWSERYFPMKFMRIGPGQLAAETMLTRDRVPRFITGARRTAARFGTTLAVEVIVCRARGGAEAADPRDCIVIASFRCDPRRRLDYFLRLMLVQLLVHLSVRLGGRPYGFGIWNSPFLHRGLPRSLRTRLVERKFELDPGLLLNPLKFFRLRTRLFNLPGLLFLSPVFSVTLGLMRIVSPLLGLLARALGVKPPDSWDVPSGLDDGGRRLLRETALRCVFCGACVATCPAYALTGDERSTGRGKLRLAEALASGRIPQGDRESPFRCLHCKLCEEVCQAGLPLNDCYEALEKWISEEYGKPEEVVHAFSELADLKREWILNTYGVTLPEWGPDHCLHPLPAAAAPREEDGS